MDNEYTINRVKQYAINRGKQFKICMKEGKYEYYCIGFDKTNEKEIIDSVTKYTTNCILISTKYEINIKDVIIFFCDMSNINDTLNFIFNDMTISKNLNISNNISANLEYILFPKVIVFPISLNKNKYTEFNIVLHNYLFESYVLKLKNKYKVFNIYIDKKYTLLRFIDIDNTDEYSFENMFICTLLGGVGDAFINHSLQYEYLSKKDMIIYHPNTKFPYSNKNIELFYGDIIDCQLIFDNYEMYFYFIWEFSKIISFYDIIFLGERKNERLHILDLWKEKLGIFYDIDPYKNSHVLKERVLNNIAKDEMKMIDNLLGDNIFIGFQFYSGSYDEENEQWHSDQESRNWNIENVENFLLLCKQNNIKIIILSPHPYEQLSKYLHLPRVSTFAYIYAISKLRLIVGIDSSPGHIASFFNIPSVTMWGGTMPTYVIEPETGSNHVGFRVLRHNMSIVSRRGNMENINHEIVYAVMINVLHNGINNPDKIISYEDSANGFNIIYVD